jgi:hypothetical protein
MLRWPAGSMILVAAGFIAACRSPGGQSGDWKGFVAGFLETYFEANPLFAVYQGRHEYDGRFPDWSEAGLQGWTRRLHQLRDSAAAFPIALADSASRFERDYLLSRGRP